MSEPLLRVTGPDQALLRQGRAAFARGRARACGRRRELRRRPPARRWGWSASPAAASPPPARCILRLIEPTAGEVWFEGQDVTRARQATTLRALRRDMQIIFQDPYASLNPRMTVGAIIGEALIIHKLAPRPRERRRPRGRAARDGRPEGRPHAPLPARVLRRPAPAHRHRARARGRARS